MFSLERWQEIFETIGKNKLRTFLTGVSVGSGIFILILLLGVSVGMQNGIEKQFQNNASNIINIYPGETTLEYKGLNPGRRIQFTNDDYELVLGDKEEVEYKSADYQIWSRLISYKKEFGSYRIQGVQPDFQYLENSSIIEGRFINQLDLANYEKNIIIGNRVKKDLFKGESPLGKYISLGGLNFKVVGVYTDPGGDREEARVYIPLTSAQVIFGAGINIRSMGFTLPKVEDYNQALAESNKFTAKIERQLKAKLLVNPLDTSAIYISNNIENTKNIYLLITYMRFFFWFVGIATLLAGIIGVSNIMLIIVKERTKEIGIRKALGAKPMSIVGMVLHESVFVTAVSGMIGLILGMVALAIIAAQFKLDFMLNPSVNFNIAVTTVIILVVSGAAAGFFPAWRGAKIKPIDALRDE